MKSKSRNIRRTVTHSATFFLLVIYFFVRYNINEELNSPKYYTRAQCESTFMSFPFPFRYRYLIQVQSRAAMLLALWKVFVYSDWSSWKKKATRCLTRSTGYRSAKPAVVRQCTRIQALIPLSCERLENWGGRIWLWSHSLGKWAHSAELLGMCFPLSTLTSPAPSQKHFPGLCLLFQPSVILRVSLALVTFGWDLTHYRILLIL